MSVASGSTFLFQNVTSVGGVAEDAGDQVPARSLPSHGINSVL